MKIIETPEKIVLRETPGGLWLFGGFFIAIGLIFALGPLFFFRERAGQYILFILLAFVLGCILVAAGLWMINRAPQTVMTFDRLTRVLSVRTWRLIGQSERHWPVYEIDGLKVAEEKDSDNDSIYGFQLVLNSGEKVLLNVLMQGRERHLDIAKQMCSLLGLKLL